MRAVVLAPRPLTRSPVAGLPGAVLLIPSGLSLAYLLVPVLGLAVAALGSGSAVRALGTPGVGEAIHLTLLTSSLCAAVAALLGTPLAYALGRRKFRGQRVVETVLELPLVLPPVVGGVALLVTFGRRGLLGPTLGALGIELPFTTTAVVLAQLFVAGPLYVASARLGFAAVPHEVFEAAAIDGASGWQQFRYVALPLAIPSVVTGAILCWARATSEFGATLLFAGNLPGRTQTLSLAIMTALESNLDAALALSVLLLLISLGVLGGVRLLSASRGVSAW